MLKIWVWSAVGAGVLLNAISLLIWNLNYEHIPGLAGAPSPPYFQDFLGLGLLLFVVGCGFMAGRPGSREGARKGVQWGAALLVIFTGRIMLLDPSEFFIRVTDWQVASGVLPWFTNADLLGVSTILLVLTTLMGRKKAQRSGPGRGPSNAILYHCNQFHHPINHFRAPAF